MTKTKAKEHDEAEDAGPVGKMKRKEYERELATLQVELVKLQQWVKHNRRQGLRRLRGPRRRRQGRHDQGDHRTGQPPRLSRGGAAGADRAREVADVHPALRAAPAGRRRGRHLRPQLVQPRRRRARHGLLHGGADQALPRGDPRRSRRRSSTPASSCSSTGSRSARRSRPAGSRARIDDARKIWKLSPMDLKSYSRWYDYSRARDEMFAGDRHGLGALVRRPTDDKKRARLNIISHLLEQIPYESVPARQGQAAQAPEARRIPRPDVAASSHPHTLVTRRGRRRRSPAHWVCPIWFVHCAGRPDRHRVGHVVLQ